MIIHAFSLFPVVIFFCCLVSFRYVMLMKPGHKYLLGTVIDEELLSL